MITEEEIEILKDEECMWKYPEITVLQAIENALQYIEQLETEKQNAMKDLEKINNSLEKDGFVGYADDVQDILSYMKGEEK